MAHYTPRYLEAHIIQLSRTFPIVLVTGARQVGKTTLLEHLQAKFPKRTYRYVTLDTLEMRTLAKNDPGLFLEQYPPPLIIDEIQYAPELLPYLKAAVDRSKIMGAYWLTGSQQFHLMKHVSESLAGRVGIANMFGLSLAEERAIPKVTDPWTPERKVAPQSKLPLSLSALFKLIVRGSFPRLTHRNAPSVEAFYGSYVQTYVDRDLRDLVKVSSLTSFEKFIRACAGRTGAILNLSDLARDGDVSVNTAKEWLGLLEASGHVLLLKPYYKNLSKRLIKAPKLYFIDTGLACYLTGWREPSIAAKGPFAGPLFETYVVGEILKSYAHRGKEARIFYFRTKDKIEVDLLIEKNGRLMPVEIKLSSHVQSKDCKGIEYLTQLNLPLGSGAVVAPVRERYPLRRGIIVIPPAEIS